MVNTGKRQGRKEFGGNSTWEGEGTGGVKQDTSLLHIPLSVSCYRCIFALVP